uniref:Uncharacterized protein n=1 Tax=virus sp. ct1Uu26 TaxID=2826789 RepID=A0A8S5R8Y2_9VIRU|nr:MAG TPA: hypothetical protein [virus sp. ct1Uu26]
MDEKELTNVVISNDTEGFTQEDYLHIPGYATVMEEYTGKADLPEKIVYNNTPILDQ